MLNVDDINQAHYGKPLYVHPTVLSYFKKNNLLDAVGTSNGYIFILGLGCVIEAPVVTVDTAPPLSENLTWEEVFRFSITEHDTRPNSQILEYLSTANSLLRAVLSSL